MGKYEVKIDGITHIMEMTDERAKKLGFLTPPEPTAPTEDAAPDSPFGVEIAEAPPETDPVSDITEAQQASD